MNYNILQLGNGKSGNPVCDIVVNTLGKVETVSCPATCDGFDLAVINCGEFDPETLSDPKHLFQIAYQSQTPLLLVDVGKAHKKALSEYLTVVQGDASDALFFRWEINASGEKNFEIFDLGFPEIVAKHRSRRYKCGATNDDKGRTELKPSGDEASLVSMEAPSEALITELMSKFRSRIGYSLASREKIGDGPPVYLKHFRVNITFSTGFTLDGQNLILDFNDVCEGFLNESAQGKSQFLMYTRINNGSPGILHGNSMLGRGWYNAMYSSYLEPGDGKPFTRYANIPTPTTKSVDVKLSYKDPVFGYQSWSYIKTINPSLPDWGLSNAAAGSRVSTLYQMTSPYRGDDPDQIWDLFNETIDFWGHIHTMPALSTGAFDFSELGVWNTDVLYSGRVEYLTDFNWNLDYIWCVAGGTAICFDQEWDRKTFDFSSPMATYMNFDPIDGNVGES